MREDDLAAFAGDFCRFAFPEGSDTIALHIPNESPSGAAFGRKLNRHGRLKGAWDWLFMWPGQSEFAGPRTAWIELKGERGKLTDEQETFGARVRALGHRTEVVYSPEEFVAALRRFGLRLNVDFRDGQIVTLDGHRLHTGRDAFTRPPTKRIGKRAIKRAMDFQAP